MQGMLNSGREKVFSDLVEEIHLKLVKDSVEFN